MLCGQCEENWAQLQHCSPWWKRGLAPGGQHLGGGCGVAVVPELDAALESWLYKPLIALKNHHGDSSPYSLLFLALKIGLVFLGPGEGLDLIGRGSLCQQEQDLGVSSCKPSQLQSGMAPWAPVPVPLLRLCLCLSWV